MKQLLEFIPLVLFFITYKMFGVREAAIVFSDRDHHSDGCTKTEIWRD